ncbi:hypothetical protein GUJ93_ZPchr0001g33083 [Zizania palustris]|uniref:Uncharacterized protein n=1 Tax=Zizania palustris TaxID=103762 RepID=A0A8J5RRX2_ZIZPA|nr:hypothetical protein GUJ93_ZPchr0001g33083 [Zizania palustris]
MRAGAGWLSDRAACDRGVVACCHVRLPMLRIQPEKDLSPNPAQFAFPSITGVGVGGVAQIRVHFSWWRRNCPLISSAAVLQQQAAAVVRPCVLWRH